MQFRLPEMEQQNVKTDIREMAYKTMLISITVRIDLYNEHSEHKLIIYAQVDSMYIISLVGSFFYGGGGKLSGYFALAHLVTLPLLTYMGEMNTEFFINVIFYTMNVSQLVNY